MQNQTIVVLGASNKPQRFSNRAIRMLMEYGYHVIPVHPKLENIEGLVVKHHLSNIQEPVDTLTLYVGADRSRDLIDDVLKLNPNRVIFNPGSECEALELALYEKGIGFVKDCTLMMLEQGRF
ncbi:MAG: CoA-binding protein [Gammaproteobacteria bacterium]|nr:MAG: CoA-binding protein [Gammaproteobacteria bacterium]